MIDEKRRRADAHNPLEDGTIVPKLCQSCEARHRGVCGALKPPELVQLARESRKRTLKAGQTVLAEDDEVLSYANILKGVAKLCKLLPDGRQQIVGLQFAPDFLGRPFGDRSRLAVEAATDLDFCTFPKRTMEKMLDENADLKQRLFRQTLDQLDEAREWMVLLGRKTAREKVAALLLLVARHADPGGAAAAAGKGALTITLPLTRSEMADFLGLTIETVSRQLTALRKSDIIHLIGGRDVVIRHLARLESEAGA